MSSSPQISLVGNEVKLTDRSSTITSGGAAQTLMAANPNRNGYSIQNVSSGTLWVRENGTAAASQPSLSLAPGAYFESPLNGVTIDAISIYGATTGQAFYAREW